MYSRTRRQQYAILDDNALKIHRSVATKIIEEPALLTPVIERLEERYQSGIMRYGSYIMWQVILEAIDDPQRFEALLLSDDERTVKLRRQTIFTGVLTEEEREQALAS
ncbi:hypothetical protein [Alteromonas sp. KUL49]|uniref:hypothetical protein n=1 Tax=Alteromonas sp. KUL49 TaxID=2480798 RepID=UPI00102F059E|nr:hypothetical protein [Alteromonas sp. KUL49]TAP41226.1 hypothetical protein EYS00_03235 [Alteromonas sp. KUL49]GEA10275.1 hypothetical protein KUL49_06500 [Alteromonas sp. KUL49]